MKIIELNWKRLKDAVELSWMIKSQFADYINISRQQLNNLESDKSRTTEDTLKNIVRELNKPRTKWGFTRILLEKYTVNYFIKK